MAGSACDIFISYRREGGSELAQLLYKDLKQRGYRVFMDVRELGAGHFDDAIRAKLQTAKDFILLLTPGSLDRCARSADDWVRQEIALALQRGLNIIPLRTTRFEIPAAARLPDDIRQLPRHNAVDYSHDKSDESLARVRGMLCSRPSWWRANCRRFAGAGVALALLLLVGGVWRGFGRAERDAQVLQRDTGQIKTDTAALRQDATQIREQTAAVRQDTRAIQEGLTRIDEQLQNRDTESGPIKDPKTKADFRSNAMHYKVEGDSDQALAAYRRYFELETGDFYDEFLGYWMFLDKVLRNEDKVRGVFRELLGRPGRKGAELVLLEKDRSPKSIEQLRGWLQEHPDYLPAYLALGDKLPRKMLVDRAELSRLQVEYQQRGGFEAARKFLRNPDDGLRTTFLRKFGDGKPLDLSEMVQVEFDSGSFIQLLAVGVNDGAVPQRISLKFSGDGLTVTVPLGEENPAGPEEHYVLFALKGGTPGQVRFEPRAENDRRMYKHCGTLYGLNSGRCLVTVSFVDGQGRPFTFPQPVNLGMASFALKVVPPDPFPMGPPRGPVLEIQPLEFLESCEIATAQEGPFAHVPEHHSVPTIRQIELTAIPGLELTPGEHEVWIRGKVHQGAAIASERLTFKIPARLPGLKKAAGGNNRGEPTLEIDE